MVRIKSFKAVTKLLKQYDRGIWTARHRQVSCACNSGNQGWQSIYNNGEQDVICIEIPNNREKAYVFSMV